MRNSGDAELGFSRSKKSVVTIWDEEELVDDIVVNI
jgi:hypothetical protein